MRQPKKLHPAIEYSGDIFIPEIDIELDEFLKLNHEHLDSHEMQDELKDLGIEAMGESVLLDGDLEIDSSQFEEREDKIIPQKQRKSFFRKLIN